MSLFLAALLGLVFLAHAQTAPLDVSTGPFGIADVVDNGVGVGDWGNETGALLAVGTHSFSLYFSLHQYPDALAYSVSMEGSKTDIYQAEITNGTTGTLQGSEIASVDFEFLCLSNGNDQIETLTVSFPGSQFTPVVIRFSLECINPKFDLGLELGDTSIASHGVVDPTWGQKYVAGVDDSMTRFWVAINASDVMTYEFDIVIDPSYDHNIIDPVAVPVSPVALPVEEGGEEFAIVYNCIPGATGSTPITFYLDFGWKALMTITYTKECSGEASVPPLNVGTGLFSFDVVENGVPVNDWGDEIGAYLAPGTHHFSLFMSVNESIPSLAYELNLESLSSTTYYSASIDKGETGTLSSDAVEVVFDFVCLDGGNDQVESLTISFPDSKFAPVVIHFKLECVDPEFDLGLELGDTSIASRGIVDPTWGEKYIAGAKESMTNFWVAISTSDVMTYGFDVLIAEDYDHNIIDPAAVPVSPVALPVEEGGEEFAIVYNCIPGVSGSTNVTIILDYGWHTYMSFTYTKVCSAQTSVPNVNIGTGPDSFDVVQHGDSIGDWGEEEGALLAAGTHSFSLYMSLDPNVTIPLDYEISMDSLSVDVVYHAEITSGERGTLQPGLTNVVDFIFSCMSSGNDQVETLNIEFDGYAPIVIQFRVECVNPEFDLGLTLGDDSIASHGVVNPDWGKKYIASAADSETRFWVAVNIASGVVAYPFAVRVVDFDVDIIEPTPVPANPVALPVEEGGEEFSIVYNCLPNVTGSTQITMIIDYGWVHTMSVTYEKECSAESSVLPVNIGTGPFSADIADKGDVVGDWANENGALLALGTHHFSFYLSLATNISESITYSLSLDSLSPTRTYQADIVSGTTGTLSTEGTQVDLEMTCIQSGNDQVETVTLSFPDSKFAPIIFHFNLECVNPEFNLGLELGDTSIASHGTVNPDWGKKYVAGATESITHFFIDISVYGVMTYEFDVLIAEDYDHSIIDPVADPEHPLARPVSEGGGKFAIVYNCLPNVTGTTPITFHIDFGWENLMTVTYEKECSGETSVPPVNIGTGPFSFDVVENGVPVNDWGDEIGALLAAGTHGLSLYMSLNENATTTLDYTVSIESLASTVEHKTEIISGKTGTLSRSGNAQLDFDFTCVDVGSDQVEIVTISFPRSQYAPVVFHFRLECLNPELDIGFSLNDTSIANHGVVNETFKYIAGANEESTTFHVAINTEQTHTYPFHVSLQFDDSVLAPVVEPDVPVARQRAEGGGEFKIVYNCKQPEKTKITMTIDYDWEKMITVSYTKECPGSSSSSSGGLSTSGIIIICIFAILAFLYVCGFCYNRTVKGRRGWSALPGASCCGSRSNRPLDSDSFVSDHAYARL